MDWVRLSLKCAPAAVEAVVGIMYETTLAGPSVEEAGDMRVVRVYLPDLPEADVHHNAILARLPNIPAFLTGGRRLELIRDIVREQNWEQAWKDFYEPFRIGRRLVIKPSWEPWPPEDDPQAAREDDIVIELDPGMAFGTGNHPSTRLVLTVIEDLLHPGWKMLDVGCGSGILSLAAIQLGASSVFGVDVDPIAAEATTRNAQEAGHADNIKACLGDITAAPEDDYDIILANISAPVVRAIATLAFERLRPGGYYVTAGFTDQWVEDVTRTLTDAGFHVVDVREEETWHCILGRKPE